MLSESIRLIFLPCRTHVSTHLHSLLYILNDILYLYYGYQFITAK